MNVGWESCGSPPTQQDAHQADRYAWSQKSFHIAGVGRYTGFLETHRRGSTRGALWMR